MTVQTGFYMGGVNFASDFFNTDQKGFSLTGTNFAPDAFNYSIPGQLRADQLTIGQESADLRYRGNTMLIKQSTAKSVRLFVRASDTRLGLAGLSAAIVVSQCKPAAGSFSTITPVITDLGNGEYDVALTTTHTNTLGFNTLRFTAANALPIEDYIYQVVAFDFEAASTDVNITKWLGTTPASVTASGYLPTTVLRWLTDNAAGTPVALTTNGYLQATLLRWLTDTAAGTPAALVDNNVPSNVKEWEGTVPAALTSGFVQAATQAINNTSTDAIAVAILDKALSGHTTAGTVGKALSDITSGSSVAAAVLDALRSDHVGIGSIGEGIAIAAGLLQGNFYMDNTVNTINGQTSARIRVFHTDTATNAATPGGSSEGEFATFNVTTNYSGPNKITDHRVVQVIGT